MAKLEWGVAIAGLTALAINAYHEQNTTRHNQQIHEGLANTGDNNNTYETAPGRYFVGQLARTNTIRASVVDELLATNRSLNECTDRYRSEARQLIDLCAQTDSCKQTLRVETRHGILLTANDGLSGIERMEITVPARHLRVQDVSEHQINQAITETTASLTHPLNVLRIATTIASERETLALCRSRISQISNTRAQLQTPTRVNLSSR